MNIAIMNIEPNDPATLRELPMRLVFCSDPGDKNVSRVAQILTNSIFRPHIEWYTTLEDLKKRLLNNVVGKTVAVVSVPTEKDLIDAYFMQHLLSKVQLVLLLPDTDRHTIAMGHRLHPCFMCSANTDVSELVRALKNIAIHGSPPKAIEQFRNPFESIMPNSFLFLGTTAVYMQQHKKNYETKHRRRYDGKGNDKN